MTFTPQVGLVIRYDYLWKSEALDGHIDGAKDRPCAIVLMTKTKNESTQNVLLCAVTHSSPNENEKAVEIPYKVARHLGLDHERMWVKTHEVNIVEWEQGRVPVGVSMTPSGEWSYGMLPQSLGKQIFEQVQEHYTNRALAKVHREP